jgi:hypothetical protein
MNGRRNVVVRVVPQDLLASIEDSLKGVFATAPIALYMPRDVTLAPWKGESRDHRETSRALPLAGPMPYFLSLSSTTTATGPSIGSP